MVAPTSVTDHSGNFINGLTASDFTALRQRRPPASPRRRRFPAYLPRHRHSNQSQEDKPSSAFANLVRCSARWWSASAARPRSSPSTTKLEVRQDFTPDLGRLTHALRRIEFSPGPNHVIDATLDAMRLLDQRPEVRRRILLLISEPRDQGSQSTLDDALADVAVSNTLIYWLNVAPRRGGRKIPYRPDALHRRPAIRAAESACARRRHHADRRRNPRPVPVELHAGQYQLNPDSIASAWSRNAPAWKFDRVPAIGRPH